MMPMYSFIDTRSFCKFEAPDYALFQRFPRWCIAMLLPGRPCCCLLKWRSNINGSNTIATITLLGKKVFKKTKPEGPGCLLPPLQDSLCSEWLRKAVATHFQINYPYPYILNNAKIIQKWEIQQ